MICYKDRTFCIAPCVHTDCPTRLTDDVRDAALAWWGGNNAPIAVCNMAKHCAYFEEAEA